MVKSKKRVLEKWISENKDKYQFSELRYSYLKQTINYLNQKGEVYLIRLPVSEEMFKIEQNLLPDFNDKMKQIEPLTKGYFNMTTLDNKFIFHDGVHLHTQSGKEVSKMIAHWIISRK
jgi:hypothetical protein